MRPTVQILDDMDLGLEWSYPVVGDPALEATGNAFPDEAKALIDVADTTFFGSSSGSSGAALFYLRWGKVTYANLRPCLYLPGCASPLRNPDGIDFVIVRENLEDLYVRAEGDLSELSNASIIGKGPEDSPSKPSPKKVVNVSSVLHLKPPSSVTAKNASPVPRSTTCCRAQMVILRRSLKG
jgi:isocitrate/isopropylmalate dehydrogenase